MIWGEIVSIADTSGQDVLIKNNGPRRRYLITGLLVLVLVAGVWAAAPVLSRWSNATLSVSAERLRIATVRRGDLVRDVAVQGRVVAGNSPTLYASDAGTITLHVEAGASVHAGQLLAEIDSPNLRNDVSQAVSALQQASVELDRQRIESRQLALERRKEADLAEVTLIAAQREKRRADAANDLGVISVIDYEKAQDDLRNAEVAFSHAIADADLFDERLAFEIRASELSVEQQRLRVADLRRQFDRLSIRSPVEGIVGDLLVQQKAAVSRDTPVLAVVDLSNFEIEGQVPESYADDLAPGMPTEVVVGGKTFAGRLTAVSPEIVANQVSCRVRFVDGVPPNLRQNQRLSTRILLEEKKDVLVLQRGQFLDSGGGRVAYVIDDDGVATRRSIEIGARSLAAVEIGAGLREGERVVISNIDAFRGADTVLVSE